jgi:homoserine dehydrogenase
MRWPDPALAIVAAADRSGLLWFDDGVAPRDLLAAKAAGTIDRLADAGHHYVGDLARNLAALDVDAVVDLLPADYSDGGVSARILQGSLARGLPCVTADKAPLALDSAALFAAADEGATTLEYTATVGGGLPVVPVLRDGLAVGVRRIQGILNGTTNHVLNAVERGGRFEDAVAQAQALGIAEADPANDLDGFDAAAKGVILHNTAFGSTITIRDAVRERLTAQTTARAEEAFAAGRRLRSVVTVEPGRVDVAFCELAPDDGLVADGATAIVQIESEPASVLRLVGPGAGGKTTAYATLRDLGRIRRRPIRGLGAHPVPQAPVARLTAA